MDFVIIHSLTLKEFISKIFLSGILESSSASSTVFQHCLNIIVASLNDIFRRATNCQLLLRIISACSSVFASVCSYRSLFAVLIWILARLPLSGKLSMLMLETWKISTTDATALYLSFCNDFNAKHKQLFSIATHSFVVRRPPFAIVCFRFSVFSFLYCTLCFLCAIGIVDLRCRRCSDDSLAAQVFPIWQLDESVTQARSQSVNQSIGQSVNRILDRLPT